MDVKIGNLHGLLVICNKVNTGGGRKPYFTDAITGGISRDRANVINAETSHVVRLVDEVVLDVLVVVDGTYGSLVETDLLRVLQGLESPDIGHRVSILGRALGVYLVELVVDDKELLPLWVKEPSLSDIVLAAFIIPSWKEHALPDECRLHLRKK